jgi:hypothetical protein
LGARVNENHISHANREIERRHIAIFLLVDVNPGLLQRRPPVYGPGDGVAEDVATALDVNYSPGRCKGYNANLYAMR